MELSEMEKCSLFETVAIVALVVYSISLHELAHAWTATWCGDPTPGRHGRLTWNPLVHLDPFYSILLPIIGYWLAGWPFGFAFTPVDPSRFRKPLRDGALVGMAGPVANLLVAAVFVGLFWIPGLAEPPKQNCRIFFYVIYWNLLFAAFNLLPLPGLDGYDIIRPTLSLSLRSSLDQVRRRGLLAMILIFALGPFLMGFVLGPMESLLEMLIPDAASYFVRFGLLRLEMLPL
jgi:Zn-dependent protease